MDASEYRRVTRRLELIGLILSDSSRFITLENFGTGKSENKMWHFKVVASKLVLFQGKTSKEVKGLKPSDVGSVLVSFEDGSRKCFQLNSFVAKSVLSKKLKKFQTTRSLFCKKTREYMAQYKGRSDSSSSTDTVAETDEDDDDHLTTNSHIFDDPSTTTSDDGMSSCTTENDTDYTDVIGVLPPLPVKTDYLYEKKIKGHSVKVHLINLCQPGRKRRVRDLNTSHVHALAKSFTESPGGEFHLLAGNIISGSLQDAEEEKGAVIEVIGGNHTRAALLMLHQQGLRGPHVMMTIYEGLHDEEALKIGLHHNETNTMARPMTFLEKVDIIAKLNNDVKAIASVFQKKNGRQVRNDLGVHLGVSKWPAEVIIKLKEAEKKWFKPNKPLSQTLLKALTKHKEMSKYVSEAVETLAEEGVNGFKTKINQFMQSEGVGRFRTPNEEQQPPNQAPAITSEEQEPGKETTKAKFSVGDVVRAMWKDDNSYDARIKKVEIIYHVQYLEDNVQTKITEKDIEQ